MTKYSISLLAFFMVLTAAPAFADADVEAAIKQGNELWKERKFAEAEAVFKKAIAEHPDAKRPYNRLAGLYLIQNEAGKAKNAYQEAITHDPENPRLFLGLALAYMHLKRFGEAEAMTRRALELNPDSPAAHKISGYLERKKQAAADPHGPAASTPPAPHAMNPHGAADKPASAMPNPHAAGGKGTAPAKRD